MTSTPAPLGADSEVGRLRTVMLHRPGPELARLTPRNNDSLLFDGVPWVSRAQDEHDAFAQALRDRDVEVLYLVELLVEALADPNAREQAIQPGHREPAPRRHPARATSTGWMQQLSADGARQRHHRRGPQRRGARRLRTRHQPARPRRLPRRPAAQPALHPRLVGLAQGPGRRHQPRDAGALARDPADRADLHVPPALRRRRRGCTVAGRAPRGRRRPAARARRDRGRRRGAYDAGRGRAVRATRVRRRASRTPCWRCRSRRSAPRCTSTPSARWSTSTRS